MKKVAMLISQDLLPGQDDRRIDAFEFDEQMSKLRPAFAAEDMSFEPILWTDAPDLAAQYDAMLPLMVWDYVHGKKRPFLNAMAKTAQKTKLLNSYETIEWNSDKKYLDELAKKGAPVISTLSVDRVTETGVNRAFETLKTDHLIIKPRIGAAAWRQASFKKGEAFPKKSDLPPDAALIQPFQDSVEKEGEYSLLFFGGQFSHGLIKRPKTGDYRIQSLYGGTEESYKPTPSQLSVAKRILDVLDFNPIYARVDLLRGRDGNLKLIELELIEPYLYLPHAQGEGGANKGAQKLAKAVKRRLSTKA